ncbi:discoidin domain-containing protein [Nocardioides sp. Leaf307]|uniref:discoidin domain-containing protein n=1 Tax=Nocardioides sp. Leaf307 TaxID=1736331 RepID=UPI0007025BE7|nr:discoidin domain-containing protein [Nocardioides sp. Leaf307]KQQ41561.1 hypothetical protein ASF50_11340 [Nocardioides sp. Leaf307]
MSSCHRCGAATPTGRFCAECGAPVAASPAAGPGSASPSGASAGRTARVLPWVVGALVVVLLAAGGALLVLREGPEEPAAVDVPRGGAGRAPDRAPTSAASPSGSPGEEIAPTPTGAPVEVAAAASITVPATAPSSVDVADGSTTSYDDTRLVDGDPTTCWRTSGDAGGSEIVLDLAEPVALSRVGLVNGYAKTATDPRGTTYDWYSLNRRVLAVEWVLDDGTTLRQDLGESRELQTLDAGGAVTSSVRLRIVAVSAPGDGPDAKDYTALSEVSLLGAPVAAG